MVTIPMLIFEDRQVMFDWLHYRYQLALLQRKKRQTQRYFAKAGNKARKEYKSIDDLQLLGDRETHELKLIDDDIHQLISNYVTSEAEKHFVPVPRFNLVDGDWERSEVGDRYRLTQEGIRELRSAIRAERKESSELARSWLTGLTGLIGVLIGLLAIILGRR
jgi:hypothetical protein